MLSVRTLKGYFYTDLVGTVDSPGECVYDLRRKRPGDAECENSIMKVPKEVFRGCQVTDHSSILALYFEAVASAN